METQRLFNESVEFQPQQAVDNFVLLEKIGQGAFGQVFKARQNDLEREVCLKFLNPNDFEDEEAKQRFKREGMILSRLDHPNITSFYQFGVFNGIFPYFATELLNGKTLRHLLTEQGRLPWRQVLTHSLQIASALEYAHSRGIIHRDIKPENLFVLENKNVKVLDFGLSKIIGQAKTLAGTLTATGMLMGSPRYMSPEQCSGRNDLDQRSDVYSLACVMYECLAGQPPFDGDSGLGLIYKHMNEDAPPLPLEVTNALPVGIQWVLSKSLSKDPDNRYQSMAELLSDLTLLLQGELPEIARAPQASRRKLTVSPTVVGAVTVVLLAAVGLVALSREQSKSSAEALIKKTEKVSDSQKLISLRLKIDAVSDFSKIPGETRETDYWNDFLSYIRMDLSSTPPNFSDAERRLTGLLTICQQASDKSDKKKWTQRANVLRTLLAKVHWMSGRTDLAKKEFEDLLTNVEPSTLSLDILCERSRFWISQHQWDRLYEDLSTIKDTHTALFGSFSISDLDFDNQIVLTDPDGSQRVDVIGQIGSLIQRTKLNSDEERLNVIRALNFIEESFGYCLKRSTSAELTSYVSKLISEVGASKVPADQVSLAKSLARTYAGR